MEIKKIVKLLREYALDYWEFSEEQTEWIVCSKIDLAMDLQGSFMPDNSQLAFNRIQICLTDAIDFVFKNSDFNFLSLQPLTDLRVVKG